MNRKISAAVLCLAIAPLSHLRAETASGSVPRTPFVKSAVFAPTSVESPALPDPEVQLRLADPVKGGVLSPGVEGAASLVGPVDGDSFTARVAIEFLEAETEVEARVIDAGGNELNSVIISSPLPARWSGNLCEVAASQNSRMELLVRKGSALGTAYRTDSSYVTVVPILSRAELKAAGGGTAAFSMSTSRTALATGSSAYTHSYDWPGTNVMFVVSGGPANTCGDIHTFRNGSWVFAGAWLCTDSTGHGVKGPWYITTSYPGQNQTDSPTYIQWPNLSTTTNTWHITDTIYPLVSIPFPNCVATAAQWGLGFTPSITKLVEWYQDTTTGEYWNSNYCVSGGLNCYTSGNPIYYPITWVGNGVFQIRWQCSRDLYDVICPPGHHCTYNFKVMDNIGDPFGNSAAATYQYQ